MKFFKFLFSVAIIAASIAFIYFMPEIFWDCTWGNIGGMMEKTPLNDVLNVLHKLGLNATNCRQWAIQRIWIAVGVGIGLLLLITLIFVAMKKRKPKTDEK